MSDLEIRKQLVRFTEGELDPRQLEDWLEDVAWDLDAEPARTLVATALRLLAEHANGDWPEQDLREQIGAIGRIYWFQQAPKTTLSGSSSSVIRHAQPSEDADRWLVVESV